MTTVLKEVEEKIETVAPVVSSNPVEEKMENEGTRKEENNVIENAEEQNTEEETAETPVESREREIYVKKFEEYTPIEINSPYYSDAGKVALTTPYDYVLENDSYFNDAAFLGDSRTLGISDYVGFEEADFYCDNGMTIYKLLDDKGVTWQRTGEKVDMKAVLQEKRYGKIYIMLGMNELGYGDTAMYQRKYRQVIRQIREWQPGVIIYVMANLHVSREKNNMETEFNNVNINDKNVAAARLANGRDIFYLDCNPLFTDEEGYLQAELTFDGVHLYAQNYDKWRTFLMEHGVEREEADHGNDAVE
ncbi:MAG: GDSL-type esterase/lipase family protein [Bacteroidales bacterium]|nr:GDSL-type esterase/lipase family protein [Bacteroidales bacterium]MCM1414298.1 GDSL-type esterase/lipase family protein [bacterium]MCM1422178.1 GDSL-type esterase/lipase family protein [bacterium]